MYSLNQVEVEGWTIKASTLNNKILLVMYNDLLGIADTSYFDNEAAANLYIMRRIEHPVD